MNKAKKLIEKLLFATASVVILVLLAVGKREAAVVGPPSSSRWPPRSSPPGLGALTINRVSLFALIFAIGILVDDAIVIVENVHRHLSLGKGALSDVIPIAVDEVRGSHDSRHLYGDRRIAADGIRLRPHGPLHESDSNQCEHGNADLAGRRLDIHAVAVPETIRRRNAWRSDGIQKRKASCTAGSSV